MQITCQRLKEILDRAKKLRIAVLGDLMVDVYLIGSADRMSQEAPVPVLRVRKTEQRPGGAANVMRNITSFGAKAVAFGVIGEDAAGEELRKLDTRINLLVTDKDTLEKFAREQFHLAAPGEDVYILKNE